MKDNSSLGTYQHLGVFIVVKKQLSIVGPYVEPVYETTDGFTIAGREADSKPHEPASSFLGSEAWWSAVLKGSRRTRSHLFVRPQG